MYLVGLLPVRYPAHYLQATNFSSGEDHEHVPVRRLTRINAPLSSGGFVT
jgi:hypothetical protein